MFRRTLWTIAAVLSVGFSTPSLALPFPTAFTDYQELRLAALDDPQGACETGLRLWRGMDATHPTRSWYQLLAFLMQTQKDFSADINLELDAQTVDRIIAAARDQGFIAESLRLSFFRPRPESINTEEKYRAEIEKHIRAAAEAQLPTLEAEFLSKKAFFEYQQSHQATSIQDEQAAADLLERNAEPSGIPLHELKQFMAISVDDGTEDERAGELFREVITFFSAKQARFITALTANNLGENLKRQGRLEEAIKHFQNSLALSETLPGIYLRAATLTSLSQVFIDLKNADEAMRYVLEAQKLIDKPGVDPSLVLQVYYFKTWVLYLRKQWKETLAEAQKIPQDYLRNNLSWQMGLKQIHAYAYEALGDYRKAFDNLYDAQQIDIQLRDKLSRERLHQLKVKMGLMLEEQKNTNLSKENELQKASLRQGEYIRIGAFFLLVLALGTIVLMGFSLLQSRKVRETRLQMQRILDHIEEGILTIDKNLHVESNLSPYLSRILNADQQPLDSRDLFRMLLSRSDLGEDGRQIIRQALAACLGEDLLNWELNGGQLPTELSLDGGQKILGLHWQPLLNSHGQLQNIIIAIRDITLSRQLEQEVSATHDRMDHLQVKLREILDADPRRAIPFLQDLKKNPMELRKMDYRQLHTIKGTARTLGLRELADRVHQLEDHLSPGAKPDQEAWTQSLQLYQRTIDDYDELCQSFLMDHSHALPRSRSFSLLDAVAFHLPAIQDLLQKSDLPFAGVEVKDDVAPWDKDLLQKVEDILLHALTNSADHGFTRPQKRGQSVQAARFVVHAWQNSGEICLDIRDNGAGLDWERLKRLAVSRGLAQDEAALNELIFAPGISTAESVSQSSGRGVGLSVIKTMAEELNGRVHLFNHADGPGACLQITIPKPRLAATA